MLKLLLLLAVCFVQISNLSAQSNCQCNEKVNADPTTAYKALIRSNNAACKALGYEMNAEKFLRQKALDSVLPLLDLAIAEYKKSGCPRTSYLKTYKLMSKLYENRAEFDLSLSYNLKALPLAEELDLPAEKALILLDISQVFNRLKQVDKGIVYARLAAPVIVDLPTSDSKAELLNKLTARYFYYYQDVKNPAYADSAEVFVNEALLVAKNVSNTLEQIIALTRLNAIYESRQNFPKALGYINEALEMCVPGKHGRQLTTLYGDKGHLLMNLGSYKEARVFADSCLHYCELEKYPPLIANAYSLIYEIENKAGNYKEALIAINSEKKITDSLTSAERARAVNELEEKYNQAKNEKTIHELAQQKQIYLLLAVAGLLAVVATTFGLRQMSLRHKQRIMETEQRLNRARMNPHFFFNSLSTLHSFTLREKDTDAIASNLSKFSHIMRETLESTYKEYITLEQEIGFLNEYLDLQQRHFYKKFTYAVHVAGQLEADEIIIPSMIVQPFIENSIEHGFGGIDYTGEINVMFTADKYNLLIEIIDNGQGLITERKRKDEHVSRASQIVKDRIYLLNVKLKKKASFTIDSVASGKGVVVNIKLPLLYITDIQPT